METVELGWTLTPHSPVPNGTDIFVVFFLMLHSAITFQECWRPKSYVKVADYFRNNSPCVTYVPCWTCSLCACQHVVIPHRLVLLLRIEV